MGNRRRAEDDAFRSHITEAHATMQETIHEMREHVSGIASNVQHLREIMAEKMQNANDRLAHLAERVEKTDCTGDLRTLHAHMEAAKEARERCIAEITARQDHHEAVSDEKLRDHAARLAAIEALTGRNGGTCSARSERRRGQSSELSSVRCFSYGSI